MGSLEGEEKLLEPLTKWSHALLYTLNIYGAICANKCTQTHLLRSFAFSYHSDSVELGTMCFWSSCTVCTHNTCWEMDTLPGSIIFDLHCRLLSISGCFVFLIRLVISKHLHLRSARSVRTDWNILKVHCCVILPEQKCCQLVFFWCVNFSAWHPRELNCYPAAICLWLRYVRINFYWGSYSALRTTLRPTCLAMWCSNEGYIVSWGHKDWVITFICGMKKRRRRKVKVEMSYRLELSSCPCSFSSPNYLA